MISEPRETGDYNLRELDCLRAIERPVHTMVFGSGAPFFDFHSLLHAILPAAVTVGWREAEIEHALQKLVHDLRPTAR